MLDVTKDINHHAAVWKLTNKNIEISIISKSMRRIDVTKSI